MSPAKRRIKLIQLIAETPLNQAQLVTKLRCSERTIGNDLRLLRQRHGRQFQRHLIQRTAYYSWEGPLPHAIDPPLDILDHQQLIALVAARGIFRNPTHPGFDGPLDGSINHLLQSLGLSDLANNLDPQAIEVDRFAACPEQAEDLITCLEAVIAGLALRGRYRNLRDEVRDRHLLPLRLLLIDGEFHLLAWESPRRPLSDLRLSRFESLCTNPRLPPGAPTRNDPSLLAKIQRHREAAFRTHGNHQLSERKRLQLAIGPQALPHLRGRTWGLDQHWSPNPEDLPKGWTRLAFTTAGAPAALHWILSLGSQVIVESPADLRQDIAHHAAALLAHHQAPSPSDGH
ncbi:MAG: WYL domain-containing protein [Planctomycetota bacterium]|nr:MAG: WYL domain-containing protein [Planctomycetota bacterium]